MDRRAGKLWYIQTMYDYYTEMKRHTLLIHARTWMILQNILPMKEAFYKKSTHTIWWFHLYEALEQINPFSGEKSEQWLHLEGRGHRHCLARGISQLSGIFQTYLEESHRCIHLLNSMNVHLRVEHFIVCKFYTKRKM